MTSPADVQMRQSPGSAYASSEAQSPDDGVLLGDISQLSMDDEGAADVEARDTGSSPMDVDKSKNSGNSPITERFSPFVLNGTGAQVDDPFVSSTPSDREPTRRSGHRNRTPGAPKSSRMADIMNKDWRSPSSGSGDNSPSLNRSQNRDNARKQSFHVQEHVSESPDSDLTGYSVVKGEDAQSIYPPSCCVFVANLLQSEDEETLQMAVTQAFRRFGPVFVKIRRDGKQMPFAFCQFTMPEHAELAIQEGRGLLIRGRPCRCEKAKAHRLFFVERKFGPVATPEDVRDLLKGYGKIEFCYSASHVERTALDLNEGVIVQFQMYDDGQSAQAAFRHHNHWRLIPIAGLASASRTTTQLRSPSQHNNLDATRAYLARYEVDRRSIFVGNLPLDTLVHQVKELFQEFGRIQRVILREGLSKFEVYERFCFAFVEFETPIEVANAIAAMDRINFGGKILRVAQKDSENGGSKKLPTYNPNPQAATVANAVYQYPAIHMGQPTSPMSQMGPAFYNSPYSLPYNPVYTIPSGPNVYTDGQQFYHAPAYPPAYYPYPASPSYDNNSSGAAESTGSPGAYPPHYTYGYAPFPPYTASPYYSIFNNYAAQQAAASDPGHYQPAYSAPMSSMVAADDRSSTPTPDGGASRPETP